MGTLGLTMMPAEVLGLRNRAPGTCPGCSSTGQVVPILYGEHTPDDEEQTRLGLAVLGVRTAGDGAPRWECLICGVRLR